LSWISIRVKAYLEQQNAVEAVTDLVTGDLSTKTVAPRLYAVHALGQTAGLAWNSEAGLSFHPEGRQESASSDTRTRSVVVEKSSQGKLVV
jgi:hypothetical protein